VDAILCVRGLVEQSVQEGGVVAGVVLDISCARPYWGPYKILGPHTGQQIEIPDSFRHFGPARGEGGGRLGPVAPQPGGAQRASPLPLCGGGPLDRPLCGPGVGRRGRGLPADMRPTTWGSVGWP